MKRSKYNRINDYINLESERDNNESSTIDSFKKIELKDISFKHNDGNQDLKNINLKLLSKGIFAIVGDYGAGKSSFLNL